MNFCKCVNLKIVPALVSPGFLATNPPVFGQEVDIRDRGDQFHFAQSPAGRVHAVLRQLDGCETLTGQRLEGGVHGAAGEQLARLGLVHEGKVLEIKNKSFNNEGTVASRRPCAFRRCETGSAPLSQMAWGCRSPPPPPS